MALPLGPGRGGPARAPAPNPELDRLEVDLLLEAIHQHYGFDFRSYARTPLRRGIDAAMNAEGLATVSGLQERVLHQRGAMDRFLAEVGVHVTSLFREPAMFAVIRDEAFPLLRTYPSLRVWIAGCATGEEVFSLAVLLDQAGLLDRSRLYATDMNAEALRVGRLGTYPVPALESARARFADAGGEGELGDHADRKHFAARFNARLRDRVTWAEHNLVTDASFNDFHLVVCANVLIYFGRDLQRRVYRLLDESLVAGGFLALGARETLAASPARDRYRRLTPATAVFQKVRA